MACITIILFDDSILAINWTVSWPLQKFLKMSHRVEMAQAKLPAGAIKNFTLPIRGNLPAV